jgi:hypothetical protein
MLATEERMRIMSLFGIFGGSSIRKQTAAFYKCNGVLPDFGSRQVAPRTMGQVLAYLSKHPGWRQLPPDVLAELSSRVADRSRRWTVYDVDHALEILVFMTEKSNALSHNFIPICRRDNKPPMDSPEARLYLFAMTFERLASTYIRDISEHGDRLPRKRIAEVLEDVKGYAEASLICDRYLVTSFMPSALGWALKNGDIDKAVRILDEGIGWASEMGTARPHKASPFDEQFISNIGEQVECIKQTRRSVLEMTSSSTLDLPRTKMR